jgi:hypothetical protein
LVFVACATVFAGTDVDGAGVEVGLAATSCVRVAAAGVAAANST